MTGLLGSEVENPECRSAGEWEKWKAVEPEAAGPETSDAAAPESHRSGVPPQRASDGTCFLTNSSTAVSKYFFFRSLFRDVLSTF